MFSSLHDKRSPSLQGFELNVETSKSINMLSSVRKAPTNKGSNLEGSNHKDRPALNDPRGLGGFEPLGSQPPARFIRGNSISFRPTHLCADAGFPKIPGSAEPLNIGAPWATLKRKSQTSCKCESPYAWWALAPKKTKNRGFFIEDSCPSRLQRGPGMKSMMIFLYLSGTGCQHWWSWERSQDRSQDQSQEPALRWL